MHRRFKVGDTIRCIKEPKRTLINGHKYKVVKLEDGLSSPLIIVKPVNGGSISGAWYEDRFVIANEIEMTPVFSLDEIEQAKAMIEDISNG